MVDNRKFVHTRAFLYSSPWYENIRLHLHLYKYSSHHYQNLLPRPHLYLGSINSPAPSLKTTGTGELVIILHRGLIVWKYWTILAPSRGKSLFEISLSQVANALLRTSASFDKSLCLGWLRWDKSSTPNQRLSLDYCWMRWTTAVRRASMPFRFTRSLSNIFRKVKRGHAFNPRHFLNYLSANLTIPGMACFQRRVNRLCHYAKSTPA